MSSLSHRRAAHRAARLSPGLRHLAHLGPVAAFTLLAAIAAAHVVAPTPVGAAFAALVTFNVALLALSSWPTLLGALVGRRGVLEPVMPTGQARTAVLMPVYEEDPARVFAAIEAMRRDVAISVPGEVAFFVLSDTRSAAGAAREAEAFAALHARLPHGPAVHYRRRVDNTRRKAGNVAEFCERWGAAYDFMVVLDADSVMSGRAVAQLIGTMEAHPGAGMLQTMPYAVGRTSLFARVQQFGARLYGPLLARGIAFWQGPRGGYWGHNAIIRIAPFMAHCGLPDLPGRAPFGGEILCHDTVEAALMGRAGWGVHLVPGIDGSYEETPTNLLDHLVRERRWCQGNLQHWGVLPAAGLPGVSRLNIAAGILHYASAPLFWLFLALSGLVHERAGAGAWSDLLVSLVLGLMFAPKLAGLAHVLSDAARTRAFGGPGRLLAGALLDQAFSLLLGPVMLLFYTMFVATTLAGRVVRWDAQARDDRGVGWREAAARLGRPLAVGAMVTAAMLALGGTWAWAPVLPGLLLGVPLAVLSSRPGWGLAARRAGLFLTPDETGASRILTAVAACEAAGFAPADAAAPALPPERPGRMPDQMLRPSRARALRLRPA